MDSMKMRAFNLRTGCAIFDIDEGSVWIVTSEPDRDAETEMLVAYTRRADLPRETPRETVETRAMIFDYNDQVTIIGLVVNESDPDDNDWGNL